MKFRSRTHIFLFLLFFCFIPSYVLAATLQISQDPTSNKYHHWSGARKFDQDEDTIDAQLPALAKQAWNEMKADFEVDPKTFKKNRPATMAALRVGKLVYFSSSLRGETFLVLPGQVKYVQPDVAEEVRLAVQRCQEAYAGEEHKFEMKCAEPLAVQAFIINNDGIAIKGQAKITTYGQRDRGKAPDGLRSPCSDERGINWGCKQFLEKIGITAMGTDDDEDPGDPTIEPTAQVLNHCFWKDQDQPPR